MADQARAQAHRFGLRRSTKPFRAIVVAASALIAATTGAASQALLFPSPFFDDGPERLIPPRAIVHRLQDQGFSEIARPRFDGTAYVIDATNSAGARVRLFVDARDGDLIGRRRLDGLAEPRSRLVRAAPGYGWTEDEAAPRRDRYDGEILIPPGEIPDVRRQRPVRSEANLAPVAPMATTPDGGNTLGLNPDAAGSPRSAPSAARKAAARPVAPKPQAVRTAPDAPLPRIDPTSGEAARATPTPPTQSAAVPDKAERVAPSPGAIPSTPINPSTPKDATAGGSAPRPSPSDGTRAHNPAAASEQKGWASPEPKRNVRVIGGATVVPGAGQASESGAN